MLAAAAPLLVAWWWRRKTKTGWVSGLRPLAAVLACQLLAISALFVWVNNEYGFYTSWSDLFGVRTERATIQSNGFARPGAGRLEVLTVPGRSRADHARKVLVWLPPQYQQPQFKATAFPVLMVLPGQPSTPEVMFRHYDFGQVATTEINAAHIKPFIAVFPPLMTNPPRDTECTNIPGGPQAYTWLSSMVPDAVRRQVRAQAGPWSLAGWSTGAFCSAKLLLSEPKDFQAAVSLGGYFTPITDRTTGDLFPRRCRCPAPQLAAVALPAARASREEAAADLRSAGQRVLATQSTDVGREPRGPWGFLPGLPVRRPQLPQLPSLPAGRPAMARPCPRGAMMASTGVRVGSPA